jgi:hypothetical protein
MRLHGVLARCTLLVALAASGFAVAAQPQHAESGQEQGEAGAAHGDADSGHHEPMGRHRFLIFTGNTFVPAGTTSESQALLVPTFGIDYSYWFSRKFGLGVAADIEIASYLVETSEENDAAAFSAEEGGTGTVARENATVIALLAFWEPIHRLAFFAGPGREFESHGSFWLLRVGAEYAFPIPRQWSIAVTAMYDHKEVYDSWSFGVAFAKRFGKPID